MPVVQCELNPILMPRQFALSDVCRCEALVGGIKIKSNRRGNSETFERANESKDDLYTVLMDFSNLHLLLNIFEFLFTGAGLEEARPGGASNGKPTTGVLVVFRSLKCLKASRKTSWKVWSLDLYIYIYF